MMQQLRAFTERANAAAARVVDAAFANLGGVSPAMALMAGANGFTTNGTTTAWNAKPVHTSAICTHGKRYERRLQEMLT